MCKLKKYLSKPFAQKVKKMWARRGQQPLLNPLVTAESLDFTWLVGKQFPHAPFVDTIYFI